MLKRVLNWGVQLRIVVLTCLGFKLHRTSKLFMTCPAELAYLEIKATSAIKIFSTCYTKFFAKGNLSMLFLLYF